jgi:hypothetical protein
MTEQPLAKAQPDAGRHQAEAGEGGQARQVRPQLARDRQHRRRLHRARRLSRHRWRS